MTGADDGVNGVVADMIGVVGDISGVGVIRLLLMSSGMVFSQIIL